MKWVQSVVEGTERVAYVAHFSNNSLNPTDSVSNLSLISGSLRRCLRLYQPRGLFPQPERSHLRDDRVAMRPGALDLRGRKELVA